MSANIWKYLSNLKYLNGTSASYDNNHRSLELQQTLISLSHLNKAAVRCCCSHTGLGKSKKTKLHGGHYHSVTLLAVFHTFWTLWHSFSCFVAKFLAVFGKSLIKKVGKAWAGISLFRPTMRYQHCAAIPRSLGCLNVLLLISCW